jgi:hypothetical protein
MIFAKDFCPLCNSKLKCEFETEVSTFFCSKQSMEIEIVGTHSERRKTNVFHYSHREFLAFQNGSVAEIIIPPYMIRWAKFANKTKIYFLPEGDESPQLIAETTFLNLTSFDKQEIINKIKTLVTFS